MNDTIIKAESKKRELIVLAVCFGIAFILNIISIMVYNTQWYEIFTMLHVVLAIALIFYIVSGIVRVLIIIIMQIISKKNKA